MLNLSLNLTKTCRIILLVILILDSVKISQLFEQIFVFRVLYQILILKQWYAILRMQLFICSCMHFVTFSAFMNLGSVLLQLKGLQNRHTKHLIESYCEFMMVILIQFRIIKYVYLCELHIWVSFVPNIFRLYQI